MVYTKLCDVCGKVLLIIKKTDDLPAEFFGVRKTSARLLVNNREYNLCPHCGAAVEHYVGELKAKYDALSTFKKNPAGFAGQKELGDFE